MVSRRRWAAHVQLIAVMLLLSPAAGMGLESSEAETEQIVQAYLAMWSHNDHVNVASVDRFYARTVSYYGKQMSRSQVLADKQAYIREWPVRSYAEVPGSLAGACNEDRSRCKVRFDMKWRRVSRGGRTLTGHAHIRFEFVSAEGGRKIAKETATFF